MSAVLASCLLPVALLAAGAEERHVADPVHGVLAASVGDSVVLADPLGRWTHRFDTGPVAWLFPAPGGALFAPDLVGGRTTRIDLRAVEVAERIDAVTMPWFGEVADRYLTVADELLVVSYPDRSIVSRVPEEVRHPWQVVLAGGDTYALVLDRDPAGGGRSELVIADLAEGRTALRRATGGDVIRFALAGAGLVAVVDVAANQLRLARAATLATEAAADLPGRPVDLVTFGEDRDQLVVAVATGQAAGLLMRWKIKESGDGVRLVEATRRALGAPPARIAAAPDGARLAVALADGTVVIHDGRKLEPSTRIGLGGSPRDLKWCDPTLPGPKLPEWSDDAEGGPSRLGRP
jgi:hypothetical protein